jgi:hypothetical protein
MMFETVTVLRFVKLSDKALSPVKGSAKAAGFDLRRYTKYYLVIFRDTFLFYKVHVFQVILQTTNLTFSLISNLQTALQNVNYFFYTC